MRASRKSEGKCAERDSPAPKASGCLSALREPEGPQGVEQVAMSGAAFRVRVTRIHLRSNRESGGYGGAVQTQASRLSIVA